MPDDDVTLAVDEAVGVVTLNRPDRLNAISAPMAYRLIDILGELRTRDDVRAVVLTGAGRAFSSGADLGQDERAVPRVERKAPVGPYNMIARAIMAVDKPIVAAVNGVATGIGLAYALACDRRFADTTARFSAIWAKRGIHADGGVTYFLPRIAGVPQALKMFATGEMLDAEAAKAAGLVDELVPEGQALPSALAYAKQVAKGPSVAIDLMRRAVYKSLSASLDDMLDFEGFAASAVGRTSDRKEGVKAFLEKREPNFTGE